MKNYFLMAIIVMMGMLATSCTKEEVKEPIQSTRSFEKGIVDGETETTRNCSVCGLVIPKEDGYKHNHE